MTQDLKKEDACSKTGTTEESIAQAEKIGFKTNLLALNPLDKNKSSVYFANFVLMDYGLVQYLVVRHMTKEIWILH